MQVTLGEEGLTKSHQAEFPKETECHKCGKTARIGFVAYEEGSTEDKYVCNAHNNDPKGNGFWPHDSVAVAVYFCTGCLETTALYNQA